ncbi:hypothetical protein HT746_21305 [Burkholderia pyrrocinia]|uniref:hypothetical protein n=1 Tax=Burkholderia pyrrocinia TaxID=60550 RepID=UPI0015761063|nr:hypothetical protein [Burkholderia pyrrocinia]NTX29628.1 hypothetical protein [Burkholderia pyrrocinia]
MSTRIGVTHSDMTYRLGGEFEDLDCSKKASVCRARVTLPLVRIRRGSASARFTCENKTVCFERDRNFAARSRTGRDPGVNETPPASRRQKMRPRRTWRT